MGVSPFTVRVYPYLPLLFCASSMCVPCFCLSVPCVLVPFFVCGLCFSVWVCWVCVLLFLCSGVLVSSLGVYVSWYLCVLCVGGLVFVYVLCSCFLCGWSCLGLRVCVWCIGCWVIWCACVSWVFCVCVCVAYCVVCALCVCSFIGCAVCFMCGVVSLLVCCVWCFGCWSLPVWLWWVSGFGRVLFFVFGFWLGFVFWLVAGVLFFVGRWCAGLVGGLFLLVVWVVFVCWGWVVASYFFGAILFVLIVVGLSGFLLASAFCLVLQPVF